MDLNNLEKVLEGEPEYRIRQANEAIFKSFISDWQEASFFPLALREKLNKECPLEIKAKVLVSRPNPPSAELRRARQNARRAFVGQSSAVKARITLNDGQEIESVLMRHADGRNTVCVSSQVGCPMGCLFCATGKMGFKRNLDYFEITEQVIFFNRYLKNENPSTSLRVTNVTFMGMGEPFLNYDNVMKAIRVLNDKEGLNIGARSISISTCGITEGIEKLIKEGLQVNLAISLHAANDELRSSLMPINKRYSIKKDFSCG